MSALQSRFAAISERNRDRALALLIAVSMVVALAGVKDIEGPVVLNLAALMVMAGALVFRRTHPLATCIVIGAAGILMATLLTAPPDVTPAVFALMIAGYSAGAHADGPRSLGGALAVVGTIVVVCLVKTPEDILFPVFIFGLAPWAIGRVLRGHTLIARELGEKEVMLRHLREQERESAVMKERSRVAREIHDVLAHNLSVMVIQASGARRLLSANPKAAAEAARLIERTGREALIELRQVFGTVRRGEGEALDGSPGLGQLPAMIERARKAGVPAELEVRGAVVELSPGADAAAYRLIQEALTNVYKHAGTASTSVTLDYAPQSLEIEIANEDDGYRLADGPVDSGGQGLVGMRERMGLYGGEVEASPRPGGGFQVNARLPLGARDKERQPA